MMVDPRSKNVSLECLKFDEAFDGLEISEPKLRDQARRRLISIFGSLPELSSIRTWEHCAVLL